MYFRKIISLSIVAAAFIVSVDLNADEQIPRNAAGSAIFQPFQPKPNGTIQSSEFLQRVNPSNFDISKFSQEIVQMRSAVHDQAYIRLLDNGALCVGGESSGAAKFIIRRYDDGTVSFRSAENKRYVTLGDNAVLALRSSVNAVLAVATEHVGITDKEKFLLSFDPLFRGTVNLKSTYNDRYVKHPEPGDGCVLTAAANDNSQVVDGVRYGDTEFYKFHLKLVNNVDHVSLSIEPLSEVPGNWKFVFKNNKRSTITNLTYIIYTNEGDPVLNHMKECTLASNDNPLLPGEERICEARASGEEFPYSVVNTDSYLVAFEDIKTNRVTEKSEQ